MEKSFRKPCSAILVMPVSICSSLLNVLLFFICLFSTLSLKKFHQLLSNNTNEDFVVLRILVLILHTLIDYNVLTNTLNFVVSKINEAPHHKEFLF